MNPKDIKPAHFIVALTPLVEFKEKKVIKGGRHSLGAFEGHVGGVMGLLTHPPHEEEQLEAGFFPKEWGEGRIHAGIIETYGDECDTHMPGIEAGKRVFYLGGYEISLGYVSVIPVSCILAMDDGGEEDSFSSLPEIEKEDDQTS
jgi:hypothetical protein